MQKVLLGWPWFALVFAVLFLAWWFVRPRPTASQQTRFTDPRWLLWLPLPVYMLHQFEEHGVDLFGRHYHFQTDLCGALGYTGDAPCPATRLFIFAVNVGTVWIAGVVAGFVGPRRPLTAAGMLGLLPINVVAHVVPSIRHGGVYNSGLLSAAVFFAPLVVLMFRLLLRQGFFRPRDVVLGVATGFAMHALLLGSVVAAGKGLLAQPLLAAVQILNGFLPLGVSMLVERSRISAPR